MNIQLIHDEIGKPKEQQGKEINQKSVVESSRIQVGSSQARRVQEKPLETLDFIPAAAEPWKTAG